MRSSAGRDLSALAALTGATALAGERLLPVLPALGDLLPGGGLQLGWTVVLSGEVPGLTSLALALCSGASRAGSWCAVVGMPGIGLRSAHDLGVDLARLALVPDPGPTGSWQGVVASLLGAVGLVVWAPPSGVRQGDARRLAARAREHGSVLAVLDCRSRLSPGGSAGLASWPGPCDLRCSVLHSEWVGLAAGSGMLCTRSLTVEAVGRGAATVPRRAVLALPTTDGGASAQASRSSTAVAAAVG